MDSWCRSISLRRTGAAAAFLLLPLVLAAATPHTASAQELDRVVAVLDDEVITFQDLRDEAPLVLLAGVEGDAPALPATLDPEAARVLVEQMIHQRILSREAEEMGAPVSEAMVLEQIATMGGGSIEPVQAELAKRGIDFEAYKAWFLRSYQETFVVRVGMERFPGLEPGDVRAKLLEELRPQHHILILLPEGSAP